MAVSVAEQFKTEGKKETAVNLLKMGMDVKFVSLMKFRTRANF